MVILFAAFLGSLIEAIEHRARNPQDPISPPPGLLPHPLSHAGLVPYELPNKFVGQIPHRGDFGDRKVTLLEGIVTLTPELTIPVVLGRVLFAHGVSRGGIRAPGVPMPECTQRLVPITAFLHSELDAALNSVRHRQCARRRSRTLRGRPRVMPRQGFNISLGVLTRGLMDDATQVLT